MCQASPCLSLYRSLSLRHTVGTVERGGGGNSKRDRGAFFFIVAFVKRSLQIPKFKTIYDLVKAYDKTLVCKEL